MIPLKAFTAENPTMEPKIFVFDTNALISAFLSYNSVSWQAYDKALKTGNIVRSPETLAEFSSCFLRSKFDKKLTVAERIDSIVKYELDSSEILPLERIYVCRDPKDNMLLELALTAGACCIVTGDKDLRVLDPFLGKVRILTAVDFISSF